MTLRGALAALCLCLPLAGAAQDDGDAGKPQVQVRRFPHAPGCPVRCKTCVTALSRALDHLAKSMTSDGLPGGNGGDVVVTCLAGLAFMANGSTPTSGPHARQIEQAAQSVLTRVGAKSKGRTASGQEYEGFGNWDLAFAGLFLAEYYAAKPSPALEQKLRFIAQKIIDQREANGGWGHAPDLAYRDLTVATNACLAALGALRMVRVPVPDDVIVKAAKYLESTSEGGVVGYSPRENQKGWGYAGRASGAAYAMAKAGIPPTHPFYRRVAGYIRNNVKTIPKDHASPTLHFLFGGLYTHLNGADTARDYRANFLDLWLSAQQANGSFICPTKSDLSSLPDQKFDMEMDAMVGEHYTTAVFALVFALPLERTHLTHVRLDRRAQPLQAQKKAGGWLGLRVRPSHKSLVVVSIVGESPAEKAGLAEEDVIVEFNKKPVRDLKSVREAIAKIQPGARITLTILGQSERRVIEVSLGEKPPPPETEEGQPPTVESSDGEEI